MKFDDLQQYIKIQKVKQNESFGLSILQFYDALSAKKRLEKILARRNKKSLFDHFEGLSVFLKQMPQSLHFYPRANQISKADNLFEKSEKRVRDLVQECGIPHFINFFKELDA